MSRLSKYLELQRHKQEFGYFFEQSLMWKLGWKYYGGKGAFARNFPYYQIKYSLRAPQQQEWLVKVYVIFHLYDSPVDTGQTPHHAFGSDHTAEPPLFCLTAEFRVISEAEMKDRIFVVID